MKIVLGIFVYLLIVVQVGLATSIPSVKKLDNNAMQKADMLYNRGHRYYKEKAYKKAIKSYLTSFEYKASSDTAINLGSAYADDRQYIKAEVWYKKAISLGEDGAYFNLALLYDEELKDMSKAIEYYVKASKKDYIDATYNLAILFQYTKKDIPSAIKWYKVGVDKSDYGCIKNLANLYNKQGEKIKAGGYLIGLLSLKPQKKTKLLNYLKTKWKLSQTEIKQAYELQKSLVANPYMGGI